jgi:hypothetical protein
MERLEERVLLSTFTVTDTLDDGNAGSLRWAINQADADTGHGVDTIDFNIPGTGPFTIAPASPLPAITHSVLVDGYSQPGASPNTQPGGANAVIQIEISGANAGYTDGLFVQADRTTIRGLAINGFQQNGIHLSGGSGDVVAGDFLGTDPTGMTAVPNQGSGVLIDAATRATIGGTTAAARDIVSGNTNQDIYFINNARGNVVQGDWVGLSAAGNATLPTDGAGVSFEGANKNTVGGLTAAAGNVIAGPTFDGIAIDSSSGVVVQGNLIGTDSTGTIALGSGAGVFIGYGNASNDVIGGSRPGAGNVISGNASDGVLISQQVGSGIVIQGNWIGTDITGTVALPNGGSGVHIQSDGVTVGGAGRNVGPTLGARNVISGNLGNGIFLDGGSFNLVQGNLIGTTAAGKPMGNGSDGVFEGFASDNTVGGTAAGAGNVIAYNGHNGVTVGYYAFDSSAGDSILSNSIFGNAALGIDLGDDGVTPNVPGGVPGAPNNLQPYPDLLSFATYLSKSLFTGTLDDQPNTTYTIQFFGNPAPDPTGHGQGQVLLSTRTVTTDASGLASFQFIVSGVPLGVTSVSATATDPTGDTSEFSADVSRVTVSSPLLAADDQYYTDINTTLNVPAPGVQANDLSFLPGPLTSVLVTQPADGTVTLNPDGSFTYTPASGFTGTDSFTYQDVASGQKSNVATVTIQVLPKTFVVTNTNDSGPGSLRQAMFYASQSNTPPPDTIDFDIPGTGPFLIAPLSALPTINHPTIIDGYSQPGASPNTSTVGDNAVILIQIDGAAAGFPNGLTMNGGGNTVEGLSITDFSDGIDLGGAGGNVVTGNFIGTDTTGRVAMGNSTGIMVQDSGSDVIGGSTPDARNVISGNSYGIDLVGFTTGDVVQGNYIGADATGESALGNGAYGIELQGAPSTTIGGPAPGDGNVIAGNNFGGLEAFYDGNNGASPNHLVIQGNLIGTDATGKVGIGNGDGLDIYSGSGAMIGGTTAGQGNVISGNHDDGIFVEASNVIIEGNLIGTDVTGTVAIGNYEGIADYYGFDDTIGGTAVGQGNVISGNTYDGIFLSSFYVLVEGNRIGTDVTGANPLGNGGNGVEIANYYGYYNTIGGTAAGAGNVIAFNSLVGVAIEDTYSSGYVIGNAILSNSIYGNGTLGIDLGDDGVTPNHSGGLIPGPNGFENYPVLSSAVSDSATTVQGTLNAAASETFTIQFFSNPTADPSGHGQGQTYLGSTTVTTDANGNASFSASLSVVVPTGYAISATATDPNGNTSEFSADVSVTTSGSPAAPAAVPTSPAAVAARLAARSLAAVDAALADPLAPAPDPSALVILAAEVTHAKAKSAQPTT